MKKKVIVFGFDGLRPDIIRADTMPNLYAFLQNNVHCTDNRCVFPSETYVNHPSIFSGFLPERHGIIANAFFNAEVSRDHFFVGNSVELIEEAEAATNGTLFTVPTLTEVLASKGLSYISLSTNTPGSTRLMAHKTAQLGGVNISAGSINYALPEKMRSRFGGTMLQGSPDDRQAAPAHTRVLEFMNEIYHSLVESEGFPDFSIVWYGEPDHTFHSYGIGSPESLDAIAVADRCFAEIVERYGGTDELDIIVVSDHGHVTITKHFNVAQALVDCGFVHAENLCDPSADFAITWGYSGNIYVRNKNRLADIVAALQSMKEVGMLFTPDLNGVDGIIPGTFSRRLVGGDSNRAGDIRFILANDDTKNIHGFVGSCIHDGTIPPGCSIHGGLHQKELRSLLGFGGPDFKKHTIVQNTTGLIDVTPTIYHLFGIEPNFRTQGRAILEALRSGSAAAPMQEQRVFETSTKDYAQKITIDYINRIPYFNEGVRLI